MKATEYLLKDISCWILLQLTKVCDCEVISFPFDEFPPHIRIMKGYAWKPLVIQVYIQSTLQNKNKNRTHTLTHAHRILVKEITMAVLLFLAIAVLSQIFLAI